MTWTGGLPLGLFKGVRTDVRTFASGREDSPASERGTQRTPAGTDLEDHAGHGTGLHRLRQRRKRTRRTNRLTSPGAAGDGTGPAKITDTLRG